MSFRLEHACPHCGRTSTVVLGETEPTSPRARTLPRARLGPGGHLTTKPKPYCSVCKHDAHGDQPCRYGEGIGTTANVCRCTGKPARSQPKGVAAPAAAGVEGPASVPMLSEPERKVLTALVQRAIAGHASSTRAQIRILTGYRPSGSFEAVLRRLREARLADGELDALSPSAAGRAAVGPVTEPPTGAAAIAYWGRRLGSQARAILEFVAFVYPGAATLDQILAQTKYQRSGSFSGALRKLCKLDPVEDMKRGGPYRASADLITPGRREPFAAVDLVESRGP